MAGNLTERVNKHLRDYSEKPRYSTNNTPKNNIVVLNRVGIEILCRAPNDATLWQVTESDLINETWLVLNNKYSFKQKPYKKKTLGCTCIDTQTHTHTYMHTKHRHVLTHTRTHIYAYANTRKNIHAKVFNYKQTLDLIHINSYLHTQTQGYQHIHIKTHWEIEHTHTHVHLPQIC